MPVSLAELTVIVAPATLAALAFFIATIAFVRWRRAVRAQSEALLAQHSIALRRFAELEERIDAARESLGRLGVHMESLQKPAASAGPAAPGYPIAIRLAKAGASREELMSTCGLSLHEAELVQRLHAPQTPLQALRSA